ncbi:rCG25428 [Rattus norvegicus]|nr:rCG25428 [Rattus norvegicus]
MKSLRDTPVRSQPDPVAEHSICERVQTSAKVEQAEELELQCVGTSSPLKSQPRHRPWIAKVCSCRMC